MNNIKIAKQLVKIAKSLVAFQLIGDVCYRIMNEQTKQISINFSIDTNDRAKLQGWCDGIPGRPTEIAELGKKYGFQDMPHTMDTKPKNGNGMYFSVCLKGNANCDMNGLIEELKEIYNCTEVK